MCLALVTLVGLSAASLRATPPEGMEENDSVLATPENVAKWIQELNADEFLIREYATEYLVQGGAAAIEPLVAALRDQQWEVNTRVVYVLQQMALSGDPDVEEAARRGLLQVSRSNVRSAAQRAHATLASIDEVRQQRAMAELVRLGAKTLTERSQLNFMALAIEIGEDWLGTDRDLRQIRWLQDLEIVTFVGERVTNEWLEHLAELPNLRRLHLKRTSVTDRGMEIVGTLKQLNVIELRYVAVTDASLPQLARLEATTQVHLWGTGISREGAAKLQQDLPGAEVDHRLGAFLGIRGDFHPLGCLIVEVPRGTAAADGGLQSGDVIVSYNAQRVLDFRALTALIAVNVPGDVAKVEFLRHAESRKGSRPLREEDRLGVTGKPHRLGCELTEVQEDSVAKVMGMEPGDVICRFNGQLIDEPATLEALFEAARVGENASFEFLRRVDLREVVVKLGTMD
jgi:hypothetical protein